MNIQLIKIPFHHDSILAVFQNGKPYVAMKPICESIGLTWGSQYNRIVHDDVLKTCIFVTKIQMVGDDQSREMLFLPIEMLQGWLFGVSIKRVRPELRETLIQYKRECFTVLYDYFTTGRAVRTTTPDNPTSEEEDAYYIGLLSEHLGEILSVWNYKIEPALLKLDSPVAQRLHDRFSESVALLDKLDRRIRKRLSPGQKPRIN